MKGTRHYGNRVRLGLSVAIISILCGFCGPHVEAQVEDCKEFARQCCRSLTMPVDAHSAYRVAYDLYIYKRGDTAGSSPFHASFECLATHDFIWSRGDSVDILRGKEESLTADKNRHVIFRSDAHLSSREIETRFRTTEFLQDTLFALFTLRSCVDTVIGVPMRVVTLSPRPMGSKRGMISSIVICIDRTDSTVHSITLKYLGTHDGVLQREIRFKEPPHLIPYSPNQGAPEILTTASGEPAPMYRGFRVVDLRNHSRN